MYDHRLETLEHRSLLSGVTLLDGSGLPPPHESGRGAVVVETADDEMYGFQRDTEDATYGSDARDAGGGLVDEDPVVPVVMGMEAPKPGAESNADPAEGFHDAQVMTTAATAAAEAGHDQGDSDAGAALEAGRSQSASVAWIDASSKSSGQAGDVQVPRKFEAHKVPSYRDLMH